MSKKEKQDYASNKETKKRVPKPKQRKQQKQQEKEAKKLSKFEKKEKVVRPKRRNLKDPDSEKSEALIELEVKVSNVKEKIAFIIVAFFVVYNLIIISQKILSPENIPDFFGYKNFIVSSGSMLPNLKVGDLIITEEATEVRKGDIITFYEENAVVTHRVIDVIDEDGVIKYKTKGDANSSADKQLVLNENIEGKLFIRIPFVGKFIMFLQSRLGILLTTILLLLIFRYIRREDEYEENWIEELKKLCLK